MPARSSSIQSTPSLAVATPPSASQHVYNSNVTPVGGFGMNSNAFFDFSGPLGFGTWDEAMLLSPNSWPTDPTIAAATSHFDTIPQPIYQLPLGHQSSGPLVAAAPSTPQASFQPTTERAGQQPDAASTSPFSHEGTQNGAVDGDLLVNTFLQMLMPPILTPVEIGAFINIGRLLSTGMLTYHKAQSGHPHELSSEPWPPKHLLFGVQSWLSQLCKCNEAD